MTRAEMFEDLPSPAYLVAMLVLGAPVVAVLFILGGIAALARLLDALLQRLIN